MGYKQCIKEQSNDTILSYLFLSRGILRLSYLEFLTRIRAMKMKKSDGNPYSLEDEVPLNVELDFANNVDSPVMLYR